MSKTHKKKLVRDINGRKKKYLKIVCFGGGNVVPDILLKPLRDKKNILLSGITSMVDNGGSTGQLRRDFNVLPPGDIRRHILALSSAPKWKKDLWQFRFGHETFPGGHRGHNFANVFIAGIEAAVNDYKKALDIIHDFMELGRHQALPSTIGKTQLMAKLENGEIIEGEEEIDVPKKHDPSLKIKKIYLEPKVKLFPASAKAIKEADLITFGPGDFYSSTLCCLLPEGMKEALKSARAKKVLIVGLFTKRGETHNFSVSDFANEAEKYMGCPLDFIVYNNKEPDKIIVEEYKSGNPFISELVTIDTNLNKNMFMGADLLGTSVSALYDPHKLIKILLTLCKQ